MHGDLVNLSQGGGRIKGTVPPFEERWRLLGSEVDIECRLSPSKIAGDDPIQVRGRVRWVRESSVCWAEFGCGWEPVDARDAACLKVLLLKEHQLEASRQREARQRPRPTGRRSSSVAQRRT